MGAGDPAPTPSVDLSKLADVFILAGIALAAFGLVLYLVFLGVLAVPGAAPDNVAALTNLVVLTIGVGLVCTGVGLRSVPRPK